VLAAAELGISKVRLTGGEPLVRIGIVLVVLVGAVICIELFRRQSSSPSEAMDESNMVMFDLSNKVPMKLVSLMEKMDSREVWIQDVDMIKITQP